MKRLSPASARNTLIIFVALAFVFIAQMSWWIFFQMRNTANTKKFLSGTLEDERQWAIGQLNVHYERIFHAAAKLDSTSAVALSVGLHDPAISGIRSYSEAQEMNLKDSLYFLIHGVKNDFIIFLNRDYPQSIISGNNKLEFISTYSGELRNPRWLTTDNIKIKPDALLLIEKNGQKYFKMFAMEGSFFLLLILVGAYMIYMALKRIKVVREEQLLFVHSITHELKIPITSLNLFLYTLKRRDYDSKLAEELVPKMKEDLTRLNQLIDNILQVRRLADREIESHPIAINLSDELEKFAAKVKDRIESTGGKFTAHIAGEIEIFADISELARVWESLIDNSLKYGNPGSIEIEIRLTRSGGSAELQFIDNGPGIKPGMEKKLFEPFYRGNIESKKTIPGSGLGLYIAREFVRRNGGEISIRNNSGSGCTVTQKYKIRK